MRVLSGHLNRTRTAGWVVATSVVLAILIPSGAQAGTIAVNRTADTPPNGCGTGGCTLREAVIKANAQAGKDTIELRSGKKYSLTHTGSGENSSATGDLDVTEDLTIKTVGAGKATIDGNNSDRVIQGIGEGAALTLKKVIVANGSAMTDGDGGIDIDGPIRVVKSIVRNNTGTNDGGIGGDSKVTVINSTVKNNTGVDSSFGVGGIDQENDEKPLVIRNSVVVGNLGSEGGGISARGPATIAGSDVRDNLGFGASLRNDSTVSKTKIRGNTDSGIYASASDSGATLKVLDSKFVGNASTDDGGGVYAFFNLRILRSDFSSNTATGSGGGVYARGHKSFIDRTTFTGNQSSLGGGVALSQTSLQPTHNAKIQRSTLNHNSINSGDRGGGLYASFDVDLKLTNSTVASNKAIGGDGGGIWIAAQPTVTLNGVTVARNKSAEAGGIGVAGGGVLNVANSLIVKNSATASGPDCKGAIVSQGFNLLTDLTDCPAFTEPSDRVRSNPKIGGLGNNGGPTKTIALKKGSPAINKAGPSAPNKDQRGRKRGAKPDIGAYERK